MTPDEARKFFAEHQTRYVLAQFVDIHGAAKAKAVPVEHYDMVVGDGAGFAGFRGVGTRDGPQGPDYMAVGDLRPSATSLDAGVCADRCDGHVNGKPYPFARVSRSRLRCGASPSAATPCLPASSRSSCCCAARRTGSSGRRSHGHLDKPCYDYKGLTHARGMLDDMSRRLRAVGIDVYQIDHEDGNGQFEINFTYADALKSADNMITVSRWRRAKSPTSTACHRDLHAEAILQPDGERGALSRVLGIAGPRRTPSTTRATSGAWDCASSAIGSSAACCSTPARSRGIAAPTVNSYKRLGRGPLVVGRDLGSRVHRLRRQQPYRLRACSVRPPRSAAARFGAAIRISSTAALIAAGLDGIERQAGSGPPHNVNLYEWSEQRFASKGIRPVAAIFARSDGCAGGGRGGHDRYWQRSGARNSSG